MSLATFYTMKYFVAYFCLFPSDSSQKLFTEIENWLKYLFFEKLNIVK